MKTKISFAVLALSIFCVGTGWGFFKYFSSAANMTGQAEKFLTILSDEQRATATMKFDDPDRVAWHFVPKDQRKGLQIKHMTSDQRAVAGRLLRSCLSEAGYGKANNIMALEEILDVLQKRGGGGGHVRDTERYYYTIFGKPTPDGRWGLSIEGHHLSLNFVIDQGRVASSSPQFLAANPGVVMADYGTKIKKGTQVLADEEVLAFELLKMLDAGQREQAMIADKAPREIRAAGEPQPPLTEPAGIAWSELHPEARDHLKKLIETYITVMPKDVAAERALECKNAGYEKIHFAWAGADKPGIGHYYRIQGPTFLIEFVNTQPDADGNPANHIHCVWRDPRGDFGRSIK